MQLRRTLTCLCLLSLAGCAAEPKTDLGDPVDDGATAKADFFSRRVQVAGSIGFGEAVDGQYATSGYTGYTFTGARGARVVIDLIGHGNDPVLYVYGPQIVDGWGRARRTARNDDWGWSFDSHLDIRLPADGTYLVLAREYWGDPGRFTLAMSCEDGECRPECRGSACPTGSFCELVHCIRSPCPSYCEPTPEEQPCGGLAGLSCPDGQFCDYEAGDDCGRADRTGVCRPQPTICTREYMPVCGCNGETYSNRCEAHGSGVAVDYLGSCAPTGPCTEDECGPAPAGASYLCEDGVTVAGPGECTRGEDGTCSWEIVECPAPQACGSRGLEPCAPGQFCNYPDSADCGRADAPGTCAATPDLCTEEYAPVCGCDGRTYSNRCHAHSSGVSVDYEGECGGGCRVAGCSGQLCVGDEDPGFSTCEWREEYDCYRGATCERQPDGACGWTPSPELEACLTTHR